MIKPQLQMVLGDTERMKNEISLLLSMLQLCAPYRHLKVLSTAMH